MPLKTIYIEVVVLKPENAVTLTPAELLAIPCHSLKCCETEKKLLIIEYSPGNPITTREKVIEVHLKAYKRRGHKVLSHIVFDENQPPTYHG